MPRGGWTPAAWLHTPDLPDRFFLELHNIARELVIDVEDLAGVMFAESACRADTRNATTDASGLIQFMPQTLLNLGWRHGTEAFRALGACEQLPWVRRYLGRYKPLHSLTRAYLAVFLPAFVHRSTDPDWPLAVKHGVRGWAYAPNVQLDADKDGTITVAELAGAVRRWCKGPRWEEIVVRLRSGNGPPTDATPDDGPEAA